MFINGQTFASGGGSGPITPGMADYLGSGNNFANSSNLPGGTYENVLDDLVTKLGTTTSPTGAERIGIQAISGSPVSTSAGGVRQALVSAVGGINTHIANTTGAHAASAISSAAYGNIGATTVQAAIEELDAEKAQYTLLASTGGSALIGHLPAGNISSTTVKNAINELDSEKLSTSHTSSAGAHTAANITSSPYGNIGATTVQAAIQELDSEKAQYTLLAATGGAALIGYAGLGVGHPTYLADTVKKALDQLDAAVGSGGSMAASAVTNTPYGNIAATNVQAAIEEIDAEKAQYSLLAASGGAALLGYAGSGTPGHPTYGTTTVKQALDALDAAGVSGGSMAASAVTNTPAGTIGSINVQNALNELDSEKASQDAFRKLAFRTLTWSAMGTGLVIPNRAFNCAVSNYTTTVALSADITANGEPQVIASSNKGALWVPESMPELNTWNSVCWDGSQFVAVSGGTGVLASSVATSPAGNVWTLRTASADTQWLGVTYTGSQLVAVGHWRGGAVSENALVMTSPDGVTWTTRLLSGAFSNGSTYWRSVASDGSIIVAVGSHYVAEDLEADPVVYAHYLPKIMSSTDGITWTERTVPSPQPDQLNSVVRTPNGFYATGGQGHVIHSSDGITWTSVFGSSDHPATTWNNGIINYGSMLILTGGNDVLITHDYFTTYDYFTAQPPAGVINGGCEVSTSKVIFIGSARSFAVAGY
jgi:hypothetical protein